MAWTLFNKKDNKTLKHPTAGVWQTSSKQQAEEARLDLFDYLDDIGVEYSRENIVVVEVNDNV